MRQLATACVGDFALAITGGATPHKTGLASAYADAAGGIPLLRVMNITENGVNGDGLVYITRETHENYLRRSRVFAGDLLVTITGRIASAAVAPEGFEGNINQHSVVIRVKDESASRYLACWLNSNIGQLLALRRTTGGTRPALDYEALKSVPVVEGLPIVKVMEKAFRIKREKEAKARELLAQIGDLLFSELGIEMPAADRGAKVFYRRFSDFSGRWEPRFYLEQFMRLDSILESRADIRRIAEIADDIGSGSTPKAKGDDYTDAACGVPFVRVCDLKNREIDYENALRITRETHETVLKRSQLGKADILLSIAGTIGLSVVVKDDCDANINQALARIALTSGEMTDAIYVSEVLNSPIGRLQTSRVSRPVVQANINLSEIGALKIPMPPMTERRKIVARILKIRAQADKIRAEAAEAFRLAKLEIERIILKNQPRKNNE